MLDQYNALESAPVESTAKRETRSSSSNSISAGAYTAEGDAVRIELCLPASQELNLNPSLLTGFLEEKFGPAGRPVQASCAQSSLTEDKQLVRLSRGECIHFESPTGAFRAALRSQTRPLGQNRKFLHLFWAKRLHSSTFCAILFRR